MKDIVARGARLVAAAVMATAVLGLTAEQAFGGAVISNGTVALGVNDAAQLNFSDDERFVGVTYEPTGNDGTRAGCECEGWGAGVADPGGNFSGFADNDWTLPGGENLDLINFTSTASTATSTVSIDDKLKVTHVFEPSPSTPNLYEIKVTLENIGTATLPDVRYTRLMDWDIEPTEFSEFVTVQRGTTPAPSGNLIRSNDNGFASPDPFDDHSPLDPATENVDYTDKGPEDHGALFDFSFGSLAAGEKKEFSIFYGAAGNETAANAAVSAAALELYSLGQPEDGEVTGEPNTFIWGFKAVGGQPVIPPTLTLTPETASNPVNTPHTLTAELKDSSGSPVPGAKIVFEVSGANPQPAVTTTTVTDGTATDTYTGTSAGDDTIKACLDNNENDACDPEEVTDTATKTWTSAANQAPTADAGADQTVASGATVNLNGGGSSDPDGDPLDYAWTQTGGPAVTLSGASTATPSFTAPGGPATLTFQLEVCDDGSPALCDTDTVTVNVEAPPPENQAPDCSTVGASPKALWPPDHKYQLIRLSGAVDPDGDPVALTIMGVTQDEPLNAKGDGDTSPDAKRGASPHEVYLRAERSGKGDGRVYRVSFTGSDGKGGTCTGSVTVGVPHDRGKGRAPIDSGLAINSFGP